MNLEPLKDKKINDLSLGSIFTEQVIKDAVSFYKRYRSNISLLMEEKKKIWKKWIDYYNTLPKSKQPNFLKKSDINILEYVNSYNVWLFDYTFSDALINESSILK